MIKNALLVIDMQNDYLCENRMKRFAYDTEGLVGRVNRLIHSYSKAGHDIMDAFLERERKLWACPNCGKMFSVHDRNCPGCAKRIG